MSAKGADGKRRGVAAAVTQVWIEKWKHGFAEFVICERIDVGLGVCVVEGHRSVLNVEEDADNFRLPGETQQLCLSCACSVLTALPQTHGPIAVLRTQRDHALPVH